MEPTFQLDLNTVISGLTLAFVVFVFRDARWMRDKLRDLVTTHNLTHPDKGVSLD